MLFRSGIYPENAWQNGAVYFYGYLAEGMVFTNTSGAPGTINMYWSFSGVCKVSYAQVKLDTGATANNILVTNTSVNGSLTNISIGSNQSVIMQSYWWGAGPSFTNSSYITGGSWQTGATFSVI